MPSSDPGRAETVSAFLSHKYAAPDLNLLFIELISTVGGIAFRVDRGKFRTSTTRLERMIRDADAFFGVWPLPGDPRAAWGAEELVAQSRYFRLELHMAMRAHKPGVALFDRRYRNRFPTSPELHRLAYDAQDVALGTAAPGWPRLAEAIASVWLDLERRARASPLDAHRDSVGLVLPDATAAAAVRELLAERDVAVVELPPRLTPECLRVLRECDFVVLDDDYPAARAMGAFLHGQFVPLLRVRSGEPDPGLDDVLYGDLEVGYRRDVLEASTQEELRERLEKRLEIIYREPELIADAAAARLYFAEAAKRKEPVFLSYSSDDRDVAARFASELRRRFQTVFDYREREGIPAGEFWQDHISGVLSGVAIGVLLLSDSYVQSGYCMDEARQLHRRAIQGEARLLPVRLDDAPAPELLASVEYRRLTQWDGPAELVAAWMAQLD